MTIRSQRKKQSPCRTQSVEPDVQRGCCTRTYVKRVTCRQSAFRTRVREERDARHAGKILTRPGRQSRINFIRKNSPGRPHEVGQYRCVVSRSGADMDHRLAFHNMKCCQADRMQGRLPIIDPALFIQCNNNILIKKRRVVRRRLYIPVSA